MKLTVAKCPQCAYRATWQKPERDPLCPGCHVPLERTSRLSVGYWTVYGRVTPVCTTLDHAIHFDDRKPTAPAARINWRLK